MRAAARGCAPAPGPAAAPPSSTSPATGAVTSAASAAPTRSTWPGTGNASARPGGPGTWPSCFPDEPARASPDSIGVMRYIVIGAGAIGGTIGGRLAQAGHEVVLVARGRHLDALRASGLELATPEGTFTLDIPA